jgi:hypothetical protein
MKGVGLNAAVRKGLTVDLLKSIMLQSIEKETFLAEAEDFYQNLSKDPNQDPEFASAAYEAFKKDGLLHLPQTRLTKTLPQLSIRDDSDMATKKIRATIDKRFVRCYSSAVSFIPTWPYGYQFNGEE